MAEQAPRQIAIKVSPEGDELITTGAHFLQMSKKDLVEAAVAFYLNARREEMHDKMRALLKQLDGSRAAQIALLAGVTREELDAVSGVNEDEEDDLRMEKARPTLRCLRHDLAQEIPPARIPLDEIDHPLLVKATERFADDQVSHERIAAVDDEVLLKVKVQRWRGAAWVEDSNLPWLVAAGHRQEGSPDDFYAALAARGRTARRRYNAEHPSAHDHKTYTEDLLPRREDRLRWGIEAAARARRKLKASVHTLVRQSLLDGHEHAAIFDGAVVGIHIVADEGHETYVAIRIIGSVPQDLVGAILVLIPGCDHGGWMYDYAMPERFAASDEQVWSNIMDPAVAAKFLSQEE